MTLLLTLTVGSGVVLILLVTLFLKEANHGERVILLSVRSRLDTVSVALGRMVERIFGYFRAGVFRATFHYILHQVLGVIIGGLTRVQRKLYELHERHIRISRTVEREGKTHLDEIAAHREETALSEAEKRKLKSH